MLQAICLAFCWAAITGAINVSLPHNSRHCAARCFDVQDLDTAFDSGLVAQLVRAHA